MNFKRILSKSSLRSSTSSGKSLNQVEEIKKYQDEIESLKLNVSSLKVLLENRDTAIGTLAREKEKLYVEVKNLQRINRNIQQELTDEREMHSKEKEFLLNNITNLSKKPIKCNGLSKTALEEGECVLALQNEIKSKDEVIYNICKKYLKLKKNKEELMKRVMTLQKYTQATIETVVTSLEDNKNSLDLLLDELRKSAKIAPSYKKYIKLLKQNADLNFQNTQLKLHFIRNIEFDTNEEKRKGFEGSVVNVSDKIQSGEPSTDAYKTTNSQKSPSIEFFLRRSKSSASKVLGVINRLRNINTFRKYNRTICYRSMSDTLLPRNFYK